MNQAIKSLKSVIWLNSLWRQDWLEIPIYPGDWAMQCLELLTPEEVEEIKKLPETRTVVGVSCNLKAYARFELDIPEKCFNYVLNEFAKEQLT